MRGGRGFTVIELLMVLAIISILAVLLISQGAWFRSRLAASRAEAVACMREVMTYETEYSLDTGKYLALRDLVARGDAPVCVRRACESDGSSCTFGGISWGVTSTADDYGVFIELKRMWRDEPWIVKLTLDENTGAANIESYPD